VKLIDGKAVSQKIKEDLKLRIDQIKAKGERVPGRAVVLVGENPASKVYVANKIKDCEQVGIKSIHCHLQEHTEKAELIKTIEKLNNDKEIDGIIVQLPLPKHLNENEILSHISIHKDVDGLSAYQMGKLTLGIPELTPCTPSGVMEMLRYYEIPTEGKRAVIIGRSNIVGKPMAMMLMKENATVTVCHSRTKDLAEICSKGDILVAAVGKARFVNSDMVKEGAVVIDVGINRVDGKLCGDVDFDNVADKCSYITPVPGGVGLMTRAMLLLNTLKAYELYA
jgi:methylenetetrahydrofolate dehydrogenase (NADP+)/methenyltetrahydrofolate cyclohydrolase